MNKLLKEFGNIDIYLFDQLLKGRFKPWDKILDAGCGRGRNLVYFLRNGFKVYGIDQDIEAIAQVKRLSQAAHIENSLDNFVVGELDRMPFETNFFEVIICNAVLHFSRDEGHFEAMLNELWRVLKPQGHLLIRLTSDIGIEHLVKPLGNRRFLLPDGSTRFLVNEQMMLDYTETLGGELFEYIKTTNVQNLRCMTTWCLQKK